jgi:spermidine/putrescine transport system permease protein
VAVPVVTAPSRAAPPPPRERRNRLWAVLAAPGIFWLAGFFIFPLYVVLCIVFGQIDPLFRTPIPVWNPLQWDPTQFTYVLTHIVGENGVYGPAILRTFIYVLVASSLCLLIAFPVSYYVARLSGKRKGLLLALLIAPFWISYMMRMFAWVNLLQEDGYVNRFLEAIGVIDHPEQWLSGRASTVVFGLIYGYIPFMILPLFGTLDRMDRSMIEAARDLGAGQVKTFFRVTLPLSKQGILAGCIIVALPMFGDYFTQTLLSSTRNTAMFGNLIVSSIQSSLVNTGAALVVVMVVLLIAPMLYYLRSTNVARELAER